MEKKRSLSAEERETIILFNDSSNECQIYTCSRPIMTKLDKLCEKSAKNYKLVKQDEYSKTYKTDKRLISFRTERASRVMTDEQKEAVTRRLLNYKQT